jgi:thiamine-monophosphate kinase
MSVFYDLPLAAGDDYELCFTVPEQGCADLEQRAAQLDCAVTRIGRIESQAGIRCRLSGGAGYLPTLTGYNHFGDAPYG